MNQFLPLFLFLSVSGLGLFSFISIALWSSARQREKEAYYRSEALKRIADSPGPSSAAALELFQAQEKAAAVRRFESVRLAGMVTIALGIALMIFLRAFVQEQRPVYLSGLIPLLIGVALLMYSYVPAPRH